LYIYKNKYIRKCDVTTLHNYLPHTKALGEYGVLHSWTFHSSADVACCRIYTSWMGCIWCSHVHGYWVASL